MGDLDFSYHYLWFRNSKNPNLRSAISLAIDEAAAITEGSSIAMGTIKFLLFI